LTGGWACYKTSNSLPPIKTLKKCYDMGNTVKSKRISGDRAHAIVMEDTPAEEWHEQLLVTVARVKPIFGNSKNQQVRSSST
jgi:hypothetical protein